MSIDGSTAGPSHGNGDQVEVQRLLTYLEEWANFPRIMLEEGVTQRSLIPLARLQMEKAQVEVLRLQYRAGQDSNHSYPPSTRHTTQNHDEPNHLQEVQLYIGPNHRENPPLRLDQISESAQLQKAITTSVDKLQLKINKSWTPAQAADGNINIILDEMDGSTWAAVEKAKVFVLWMLLSKDCLLYTSPSPRDATLSRMPSSA